LGENWPDWTNNSFSDVFNYKRKPIPAVNEFQIVRNKQKKIEIVVSKIENSKSVANLKGLAVSPAVPLIHSTFKNPNS